MNGDIVLNGGLIWVLVVLVLPLLGGMFWFFNSRFASMWSKVDKTKEDLATYKLQAAEKFVTTESLKNVEARLTDHLVRIENKLDNGHVNGKVA